MSPVSIPAAFLIGPLRYSRHAPSYFTILCVNFAPFSFPFTAIAPVRLPAFLKRYSNTPSGTSTTGLIVLIMKILAENDFIWAIILAAYYHYERHQKHPGSDARRTCQLCSRSAAGDPVRHPLVRYNHF